jgi:hypothetical protein
MAATRITVARELVPSLSRLESAREREHYWRALLALWGARGRGHPGCHPMSLARTRLPDLGARRYGVGLKADGVRYALLLTTRPTHAADAPAPVALMVDRARNMYEVEVVAPEPYFARGTLLEGELVWRRPGERAMLFLVFDALCVKGEPLAGAPFEERLRRAEAATRWSAELDGADADLEARVREADAIALVHYDPPLAMRPKRFVDRAHAARLWAGRHEAEHASDGLVLQDLDAPYVCGTAEDGEAYKWKESSTVDLAREGDGAPRAADGPLPATLHGRAVRVEANRVSEAAAARGVAVLEYLVTVTADEVVLLPTRTRPDKERANGLRVVAATVKDVLDDVRVDELCG